MIKIIDENIREEAYKMGGRVSLTAVRHEDQLVAEILTNIQQQQDRALLDYTNRFDRASFAAPDELRVTSAEMDQALQVVPETVKQILNRAIENIRAHHIKQVHSDWTSESTPGALTGIRYTPLESVGVYVPGGTAVYPSTVLMNVIPAQVAGVRRIVMVTPPSSQGKINPVILVAARLLNITEVYKVGGAQAVGALAFGTPTIPKVDKIVGPGNIWVTLAKKQVYGICAIDKLAGPSDITVLADRQARADYIAADMLSQAEHDVLASAIAVVPSFEQATAVKQELIRQTQSLSRSAIIAQSLANYGAIFVADDIDQMAEIANIIAPEHLELLFADHTLILSKIRNAGAIFCGYYSPEPLGDYFAGANHVLPTGGTARFESPLGVDDFVKKTSIIQYTHNALKRVVDDIEQFAILEGLDAHARSIAIRRH